MKASVRESEQRFRELAENVQEVFWITEVPGSRVSYVSPAYKEMWGLEPEEIYRDPRNWLVPIHPADRGRVEAAFAEKAGAGRFDEEYRLLLPDGSTRWVHDRAFPVRDKTGEVYRIAGIAQDITKRKRAEERLRESHEELERKVAERTRELSRSLEAMKAEIAVRKQTEEQLREMSARVLRLQDEERRHLARELHDSTAQTLSALSLNLAVVNQCSDIAKHPKAGTAFFESLELAEQASREIRTFSYLLHPPLLDEAGLGKALEWFVSGFEPRTKIEVLLQVVPPAFERLPQDVEMAIFRIVQECLTNIYRHSGSPTAGVRLLRDAEGIQLDVWDHGKGLGSGGLNCSEDSGVTLGVGTRGMRERVRQLGGRMEIRSGNPPGTHVEVFLPVAV